MNEDRNIVVEATMEFEKAENGEETGTANVRMAPTEKRDRVGDMFLKGSFDDNVGRKIPVLQGHKADKVPVGILTVVGESNNLLWGKMTFADHPTAQEWRAASRIGAVKASVGYQVKVRDLTISRKGVDIKKAWLRELSLTGAPMMEGTGLSRVKTEVDTPAPTVYRRTLATDDLLRRASCLPQLAKQEEENPDE